MYHRSEVQTKVAIDVELLKEMKGIIEKLDPSNPCVAKAQRVLDFKATVQASTLFSGSHLLNDDHQQTPLEKFHGVIRAKLDRGDKTYRSMAQMYGISINELEDHLNKKEPYKGSPFTLQSLMRFFGSSPGYWSGVYENCFGRLPYLS